jgi:hypothetical protein
MLKPSTSHHLETSKYGMRSRVAKGLESLIWKCKIMFRQSWSLNSDEFSGEEGYIYEPIAAAVLSWKDSLTAW